MLGSYHLCLDQTGNSPALILNSLIPCPCQTLVANCCTFSFLNVVPQAAITNLSELVHEMRVICCSWPGFPNNLPPRLLAFSVCQVVRQTPRKPIFYMTAKSILLKEQMKLVYSSTLKSFHRYCLMAIELQFCKMVTVLEMDGGDGCTTLWMYFMPLSYTIKNG